MGDAEVKLSIMGLGQAEQLHALSVDMFICLFTLIHTDREGVCRVATQNPFSCSIKSFYRKIGVNKINCSSVSDSQI